MKCCQTSWRKHGQRLEFDAAGDSRNSIESIDVSSLQAFDSAAMTNKAQDWKYEQQVPSQPDVCVEIIRLLLDQLESTDWPSKDVFGIHMAMEEAIMNAIRHGNQCAADKQVHVLIAISADQFYAKITDQGDGFDPSSIPDPTLDENVGKTCGRGVVLMKSFVDEIVYNKKGNSVELKKSKTK